MITDFKGRTAVLTGAGSGFGLECARIGAGLGWQSLVGAELIVAQAGVGYMMVQGQSNLSTPTVVAGMIAIGVVGLIIDVVLRQLEAFVRRRRGLV